MRLTVTADYPKCGRVAQNIVTVKGVRFSICNDCHPKILAYAKSLSMSCQTGKWIGITDPGYSLPRCEWEAAK